MHRSISNATEVREPYPMMSEGVGKRDGCLCDYLLSGLILREEIYSTSNSLLHDYISRLQY